jgi:hypothetical protein
VFAGEEEKMRINIGPVDRIIRLVLAAVIAVLYLTNAINGTWAVILGILAVAFFVTSFVGFCPLYVPLGISTKKKSKPAA